MSDTSGDRKSKMYTNGATLSGKRLVPRLELSAVPDLETPPRPEMSFQSLPGDPEDEDEQHPPLLEAGQSEILAYDESESDESDYFKEPVSTDSGVSMDEEDEEVFTYEQGHSASLLVIFCLGRANLSFLGIIDDCLHCICL